MVGLAFMPEAAHQWWGKVEWNPSRVVDPDGWGLSSVQEARFTVGGAEAAASTRMRSSESARNWRVKRLDVARDFEAGGDSSAVIRALSAVHRPWSKLNMVHADPRRNGAQTLMVGSKSGGVVRLYDKEAETHGDAPEGTVRFEIEGRSDWCARYGAIAVLDDITDDSCEAFGKERFGWSGMGAEVSASVSALVHRVASCSELTAHERTAFVGFLVHQAAGVVPPLHRNTLSKYRRLQRELGIVSADVSDTVEVVRRLDWDSGTEVLRVA